MEILGRYAMRSSMKCIKTHHFTAFSPRKLVSSTNASAKVYKHFENRRQDTIFERHYAPRAYKASVTAKSNLLSQDKHISQVSQADAPIVSQ